jgi:hypothetical protein
MSDKKLKKEIKHLGPKIRFMKPEFIDEVSERYEINKA